MTTSTQAPTRSAAARAVEARKTYGTGEAAVHALDGVTVDFPEHEFTAIMGPSGSGKSTLMQCVAGLDRLTAGSAYIGDTDISKLNKNQLTLLRRDRLGFIFQQYNLIPSLTARENILLPLTLAGTKADGAWFDEIVRTVGLQERLGNLPSQLSGGQQQRVAIARALVMRPKAMLFDEPTSALDVELVREVLDVMEGLVREGMTMVVVSHELRFAQQVASSVLMMDEGQVIEEAPPDRFFSAPSHERTRRFLALVN